MPTPAIAQGAPQVPYLEKWQGSPHANKAAESFRHWDKDGKVPKACATCHSSDGYLDFLGADGSTMGKVDASHSTDTVITCTTCHNDETLIMTEVTFPSGAMVADAGRSMRCMVCHQGRQSGPGVHKAHKGLDPDTVSDKVKFQNVHYRAAGATMYGTLVKGGYEYPGQSYKGQFKHVEGFAACSECHDAHSTKINPEQCAVCHKKARTGDLDRIRVTAGDFDGDGNGAEGIAMEIDGLHSRLYAAMQGYAKTVAKTPIVYDSHTYPYFFTDLNANGRIDEDEAKYPNAYKSWTPRLAKAAYNYQFVAKDPGGYAHNGMYMVQLLFDAITDLNGDSGRMNRP
ncbi:polyheme membrane-associated cytochrome C [Pseudomonadota bacterium]